MITQRKQEKNSIRIFLFLIATLIIIGFIFIYSSSSVYALESSGSAHYFVKKQLLGLFIGLIALFIARLIPARLLSSLSPWLFLGSLGLTALTLFPIFAHRIHGSSRWISLGVTFQPSELLKIFFILYLASLLAKKETKRFLLKSYLPFLLIIGITSLILLKQPDFGLTVTLLFTAFMLLFTTQFPMYYLLSTIVTFIPIGALLIYFYPYRIQRILTFLNPWHDPKGTGFQIIQSLIAIGAGNVTGVGIAHSKQKFFYLPMLHTDFIFSIIAEETGFLGSCFLITIYIFLLYTGFRLAGQMRNRFYSLTILGYTILISLQAAINIAVATGLVPTKGIGLPFVSYGNSSLVCNLFMIGIILNMVHNDQ